MGLLDLVRAPDPGQVRASGALAAHVLEVMEGVLAAAEQGRSVPIGSHPGRPAPVPLTQI